jgi:acyl carrier protein
MEMVLDRQTVFEKVRKALAESLEIPEEDIREDSLFKEDLDADSLDLVELLLQMERVYGFKVSDDEASEIITVGNAVDLVLRKTVKV